MLTIQNGYNHAILSFIIPIWYTNIHQLMTNLQQQGIIDLQKWRYFVEIKQNNIISSLRIIIYNKLLITD